MSRLKNEIFGLILLDLKVSVQHQCSNPLAVEVDLSPSKIGLYCQMLLVDVDFSSIVRHSPSHGQWENAGPLSWIRVDLVKD